MKTKIISIALLLVMILCTLTGCAYNYEKKDLSDYATIDGVALKAALQTLVIEDGDFTSVEATRETKTYETIQNSLTEALAASGEKQTEGTIPARSVVTYCFYMTAVVDSETKYTNMSKMLVSNASSITLTNDDDKTLNAIREALTGYTIDTHKNYVTSKDGTVGENMDVIVTYTEDDGSNKLTYTNMIVKAENVADTLGKFLIGKSFNTKYATEATTEENDKAVECGGKTYTDITITTEIETGEEKVITLKPYTENSSFTDVHGGVVSVTSDTEVQYHIYVIDYVKVPDIKELYETSANEAVKAIIFDILGDDISTKDLDIFTDEQYYYEENNTKTTLSDLISGFEGKYKALSAAQSAYDKVMEDAEADQATKNEKLNALNDAKAALDRDTIVTEINKCRGTEPETNVASLINEKYYQSIYDELESDYESEIAEKIIAAVDAKIKSLMTVTGAPKQAVKNAYKTNRANYKYTYYTGSNDDSESYTDVYETFDAYLEAVASTLKGSTVTGKAAVKEVLMEEATADVKELVQVYVLAKAVNDAYGLTGDEKITVTKDDINYYASYMASYYYYIYQQQFSTDAMIEMFGEDNIRAYYLLDRTMSFLVEKDSDVKDPKVAFKHVKYEFKTNDVN